MPTSDPYQLMYRTLFDVFFELAFEVLHPGEKLLENWHIGVVAQQLIQFMAGTHNRLIINLPPRSLKSFMTSIAMPAFLLGQDPRRKILILAGTSGLADDLRQKAFKLMRSDRYRGVFDGIEFAARDRHLHLPQGGSLSFLRYGESIIGKGYDVIIIDDPQSPSQVEDTTKRDHAPEYFKNEVIHRLNSKTQGGIVIVQQRLHESDLTGSVFRESEWQCLAISAVSCDVEKWPTPRGGFVIRNKGVALCEERESKQTIEEQLTLMGAEKFAAQYLQEPYMGVAMHRGSGQAWYRSPDDWDGKTTVPYVFFVYPDPMATIRETYFDGPPSPYIWSDPNPPKTIEEWEKEAIAQQAAAVQRAQEDSNRR